ncbi:MAG: hypothetical protein QXW94_03165, partial [Desulfurococcaceae archaeon]
MPLERVIEFRVAGNVDALPELIYFLGKAGVAMFEERPAKLPRPRDPALFQKAKKIDEVLNQLLLYVQPRQLSLPLEPLESQVDAVLEKLAALQKEVSYYLKLVDELKAKLSVSREVAALRAASVPKTEVLETLVALPGKSVKEAAELVKTFNASAMQYGNALIIAVSREKARQLRAGLERLGARVFSLWEIAELEPPEALQDRLKKAEEELASLVQKHSDLINYAYTLRYAVGAVMDVYNKSAIDEGSEVGRLFASYEKEIEKVEKQLSDLRKIKLVLDSLGGGFKLPEGFRMYVDPETPIAAPHVLQEVGGVKVALVRGEARGVEVPPEYLADVEAGRRVVEDAIRSAEASLQRLRRDLEALERQYSEYSLYGDKKWEEHNDMASLVFYVLEKDVKKVDEALSEFAARNIAKLDVVRRTRYKYFDQVPAERRPTLEKYPTPIRQFTKIVYMYGVPRPYEISPVPLAALLFPIFFGWMY